MEIAGGTLEQIGVGVVEQVVRYTEPDDLPGVAWVFVEGAPAFRRRDVVLYRHGGEGGGEKRLWITGVHADSYACGFGDPDPGPGGERND